MYNNHWEIYNLDINFGHNRPFLVDPSFLWLKLESHIKLWEANFRSKASRVTLIQHNLEAILANASASLLMPTKLAKPIEHLHRDILWNEHKDKKSLPMISQNKICMPMVLGGLELQKLRCVNQTYLDWVEKFLLILRTYRLNALDKNIFKK